MVPDKRAWGSAKRHRDQGGAARAQRSTRLQRIQGERKERSPRLIWAERSKIPSRSQAWFEVSKEVLGGRAFSTFTLKSRGKGQPELICNYY